MITGGTVMREMAAQGGVHACIRTLSSSPHPASYHGLVLLRTKV